MLLGRDEAVAMTRLLSTCRGIDPRVDDCIKGIEDGISPYQASVRQVRSIAQAYQLPEPFPTLPNL